MSDIDTAVVDGLKVLDPNGRLEKLPRRSFAFVSAIGVIVAASARLIRGVFGGK